MTVTNDTVTITRSELKDLMRRIAIDNAKEIEAEGGVSGLAIIAIGARLAADFDTRVFDIPYEEPAVAESKEEQKDEN